MIGTALEVVKTTTADSDVGLLAGIGQRLLSFCDRFGSHFRSRTRTVETSVKPIKTGTYLAFYNVLKIPMAFSSKGQTNRFRKAVSQ